MVLKLQIQIRTNFSCNVFFLNLPSSLIINFQHFQHLNTCDQLNFRQQCRVRTKALKTLPTISLPCVKYWLCPWIPILETAFNCSTSQKTCEQYARAVLLKRITYRKKIKVDQSCDMRELLLRISSLPSSLFHVCGVFLLHKFSTT